MGDRPAHQLALGDRHPGGDLERQTGVVAAEAADARDGLRPPRGGCRPSPAPPSASSPWSTRSAPSRASSGRIPGAPSGARCTSGRNRAACSPRDAGRPWGSVAPRPGRRREDRLPPAQRHRDGGRGRPRRPARGPHPRVRLAAAGGLRAGDDRRPGRPPRDGLGRDRPRRGRGDGRGRRPLPARRRGARAGAPGPHHHPGPLRRLRGGARRGARRPRGRSRAGPRCCRWSRRRSPGCSTASCGWARRRTPPRPPVASSPDCGSGSSAPPGGPRAGRPCGRSAWSGSTRPTSPATGCRSRSSWPAATTRWGGRGGRRCRSVPRP